MNTANKIKIQPINKIHTYTACLVLGAKAVMQARSQAGAQSSAQASRRTSRQAGAQTGIQAAGPGPVPFVQTGI